MSKEKLIELRNNIDWIVNKVNNKEVSDSEMYAKLSSISPLLVEARNRLDRVIEFHKQYVDEQYYDIVDKALDDYFAQYFAQKRIMSKAFGVRD